MSLGSFLKKVVKAAKPIAKAAIPVVAVAVITHTSLKSAALNAVKNELDKQ